MSKTPKNKFTKLEWMVLRCAAGGIARKDIALALCIPLVSVHERMRKVKSKLRAAGHTDVSVIGLNRLIARGIVR